MSSAKERLDALLVARNIVDSRTRAQAIILAGEVVVGEQRIDKPGTRVDINAPIRLKNQLDDYVSRGAHKLLGALKQWPIDVNQKICVDIGASTGGFTDVLLRNGAQKVFAIDVGHAQLADKIRRDPRVVNMEKTHVVRLPEDALDPKPSIAVIDVSFISLTQVLPAAVRICAPSATIFALIKPQFEVGRLRVGKGGIVRDEAARQDAIEQVCRTAEQMQLRCAGIIPSPITGTDGNIEYLARFDTLLALADDAGSIASLSSTPSSSSAIDAAALGPNT